MEGNCLLILLKYQEFPFIKYFANNPVPGIDSTFTKMKDFFFFFFHITIALPWLRFTLVQMVLWKHNCICTYIYWYMYKDDTFTSSSCPPFLFQELQEPPVC
jgi:hypothetical protein